jgi:hypothetical protein
MGIVQSQIGFFLKSTTSCLVYLPSPVTKGNLIVVGVVIPRNSRFQGVGDGSNDYQSAIDYLSPIPGNFLRYTIYHTKAGASGPLAVTVDVDFTRSGTVLVYEVSGYALLDQIGSSTVNSAQNISITTNGSTGHAREYIFGIVAGELTADWTTDMTGVQPGVGSTGIIAGGKEVTIQGVQTLNGQSSVTQEHIDGVLATFYAAGPA